MRFPTVEKSEPITAAAPRDHVAEPERAVHLVDDDEAPEINDPSSTWLRPTYHTDRTPGVYRSTKEAPEASNSLKNWYESKSFNLILLILPLKRKLLYEKLIY
ncbi:hypothetical protein ACJ73_08492 [Blastomyces percursus]|uniref:Uncharacterized protein n=1 Tax=Blastomyces percursus TaxID=1658174 RepID=A0A1J9PW94_9EURO|nr:hypothetical protein ACJ73_08492 [Blastomyces percursus]